MATTTLKTDRPTFASDFIPADIDKAVFLGNPILDNMMTSLIALGAEVWSNRRRMKVVEALLAEKGVTNEMIEQYMPSTEEEAEWQKDRGRFIDLAYSPLLREGSLSVSAPFQRDNK